MQLATGQGDKLEHGVADLTLLVLGDGLGLDSLRASAPSHIGFSSMAERAGGRRLPDRHQPARNGTPQPCQRHFGQLAVADVTQAAVIAIRHDLGDESKTD